MKSELSSPVPDDYGHWLVRLYHRIGTEILERQQHQGWGAKVIERLSSDLRDAFPDMKSLSSSNLKYMRFFAQLCPQCQVGQQPADQLPCRMPRSVPCPRRSG